MKENFVDHLETQSKQNIKKAEQAIEFKSKSKLLSKELERSKDNLNDLKSNVFTLESRIAEKDAHINVIEREKLSCIESIRGELQAAIKQSEDKDARIGSLNEESQRLKFDYNESIELLHEVNENLQKNLEQLEVKAKLLEETTSNLEKSVLEKDSFVAEKTVLLKGHKPTLLTRG